ncbi:class B sortase [Alkaliphilus transvaalensis]|uniref:class B sortase n=1 Tax=Alkaliphilus transvaalensis TaxID=114628 RepID=UPI00068777E4|nr:class B sortase [Alkaliphilus transvaalensis]
MNFKKVILLIWGGLLIYIIYTFAIDQMDRQNDKQVYEAIRNSFYGNEALLEETKGLADVSKDSQKMILERYHSILEINEDLVGWITVTNTRIDYPVVKGEDNDFYLRHNLLKEQSKAGAIFMDFRNKAFLDEEHKILYGHNMRDGSMFKDLLKYQNEDFLYHNPIIKFSTLYEEIKWEIFSVYVTSVDFYYIQTEFNGQQAYQDFLKSIKEKSIFNTDVEVSEKDQILTLSTCSYDFDNARFVLHARRIN